MPVLVAVGCSSSLGSLALQRFLSDSATDSHWTVYAAHRSPEPPSWHAHDHHHVEWIPLELESLASVQRFAERITSSRVDLVWLNAAIWDEQRRVIQFGGQAASWTREAVVNCIAQHYLVHLLADKLAFLPDSNEEGDCVVERARIVWTTSNLHKSIPTLAQIPLFLRAATPPPMGGNQSNSEHQHDDDDEEEQEQEQEQEDTTTRRPSTTTTTTPAATPKQRYAASKAAQLVAAFYWRRHFFLLEQEQERESVREEEVMKEGKEGEEECSSSSLMGKKDLKERRRRRRPVDVVAVSPGFVPSTNLSRDSNWFVRWLMRNVVGWFPFAVSVEEGAARIARSLQMISTLTTASSSSSRSDPMDAAAADDDQQQRQPSAPDSNEEGDSIRPSSQPDSNAAAASTSTSTSNSDSDSQALEALLRAIPPSQVLYLSLPSTALLPSPHLSLGQTPSQAGSTQNRNQNQDEGKEDKAGSSSSEYLVQGGAVGEWAARGGCDWDEVEGWGILPSRENLDRFAEEEARS